MRLSDEGLATFCGDCLKVFERLEAGAFDLAYLDPPFFTQKVQSLGTRDGAKNFSFADIWDSDSHYADFVFQRFERLKPLMKTTGSVFVHCDKSASHIVRLLLDAVFGAENFRSEIIWTFRRWSNSSRGLLPAHQTIYFYSLSDEYKFNRSYEDYSPTTNIDQIMQKRVRDGRNKSVYATDSEGRVISNGAKKGVPMSDVWQIPFLNPKAKERVGYPTQKPVALLERIIELVTDEGDLVLDPFCGSGTTLVAAKSRGRRAVGIDKSSEAIDITKERIANPVITRSALMEKGAAAYQQHNDYAAKHLAGLNYRPVQRNKGIDGILATGGDTPVFLRVQRPTETLEEAARKLTGAAENKGDCDRVLVATSRDACDVQACDGCRVVPSLSLSLGQGEATTAERQLPMFAK